MVSNTGSIPKVNRYIPIALVVRETPPPEPPATEETIQPARVELDPILRPNGTTAAFDTAIERIEKDRAKLALINVKKNVGYRPESNNDSNLE